MKINKEFIDNIFKLKMKLKEKKDKIKLSQYEEYIPMYDIYSQMIYPIYKMDLQDRLKNYHFRFINNEIYKWIILINEKSKLRLKDKNYNQDDLNKLIKQTEKMISIMNNYDIETLIETSHKTLYKYSEDLGLSISICKRNSFHPYITYLNPYYTKNELIKLGQNMKMLDIELEPEYLLDENKHYEICKNISNNDVSFREIDSHTKHIIENNFICDVVFYSFIGSSILNRYLRDQESQDINDFYYNRLIGLVKGIQTAPALVNDYQIYRFVSDDVFLKNLKVGDTFIDKGFVSTTRDPFYSPGVNNVFGMVLIKINLKKNIKGMGLFMEHFSLFPKEEEFLLPPMTKLKLVSKDEHFKYYHTNENFEKNIKIKYEFDFIESDYSWISNIKPKINVISSFNYNDNKNIIARLPRFQFYKTYIKSLADIFEQVKIDGYKFVCLYFDSLQAYSKFYYNKTREGISLINYDNNGYINIEIEIGDEIVINYMNQFYFYNTKKKLDEKDLNLIFLIGYIFYFKKIKIYNNFENFSKFKDNYSESLHNLLYINMYDSDIYNYIKYNKKPYTLSSIYDFTLELELLLENDVSDELKELFNFTGKTTKELIIDVIENKFYLYNKLHEKLELFKYNYCILNVGEEAIKQDKKIDQLYDDDDAIDNLSRLIYRETIRRYN